MDEKSIIKTIFNFFIIDAIIFSVISIFIALVFGLFLELFLGDFASRIITILGFVIFLLLMWSNYRIRYVGKFDIDDAKSILKTRYAKGEISKEQFEQMKKELEK